MKKFTSFVLALAMIAIIVSGCKGDPTQTTTTPPAREL
jgi:hypothetical protein